MERIKFEIETDVFHALINAMQEGETLDNAVARFLRIAFKIEIPVCIGDFPRATPPNHCRTCQYMNPCARSNTPMVDDEYKSMKELIEEAKRLVIYSNSNPIVVQDRRQRRWLEAHIDAYGVHGYQRITLLALEGSPCRGYIVVNHSTRTVTAFDSTDTMLKQLRGA